MQKKRKKLTKVEEVQRWFRKSVAYEGEPYVMDAEQTRAVVCDSLNTIVAARAGSGKTRTIVAKIVYLIAKCGVKPDEIMTFVFNANAAKEINERLMKMAVDGVPVMSNSEAVADKVRVASTFHAFARKVVYDVCGGRKKCGKILVAEREKFVLAVVAGMMKEPKWAKKIRWFINGEDKVVQDEQDMVRFVGMMGQFINRAQQQYLAGERTLRESVRKRLKSDDVGKREKVFIELGVECYRRYHWYLLNGGLAGFCEYGTDFNLLVSWASKLIKGGGEAVQELLGGVKYVLIDEYQDFSQLFLAVVLAIREMVSEVKLFVVGDDWQAINRFAGSEVEYFKEFGRYFPEGMRRLEITTNYRCNYEIVDRAGKFMRRAMKEKGKFRAFSRRAGKVVIVDPRLTACEYAAVDYDRRVSGRDRVYAEMARRMLGRRAKEFTVQYVKTLVQVMRKNWRYGDILLLHRNNETGIEGIKLTRLASGLRWGLAKLGVMSEVEFDTKVRVMTMHKSKGLEADVVIILEADEGIIPKIHPDTMLYGVFGETEEVAMDDQKRLFYVAMTRAKKRLYIINDSTKGKGFVKYLGRGVERWE